MKILEDLQIDLPIQRLRQHLVVAWKRPPVGWFKLNCVGNFHGNLGSYGGGGVIRDKLVRYGEPS